MAADPLLRPHTRLAVTSQERLRVAVGTVQRLRWVLDASLRAGCPEEIDPNNAAELGAWLAGRPVMATVEEELLSILARGRVERPEPREAWVPCAGPAIGLVRRRWVEIHLEVPVRAVG